MPVGFLRLDLPATKYKLALTMKTAKALRITVPSQLARRDEVIE